MKQPLTPYYLNAESRARLRLHAMLVRIYLRAMRAQRDANRRAA